jgi:uncharacterized membrane protein YgdD (TMEM256/DUF423 family)
MKACQIIASLCMALGVASGAFGAHALRDIVSPSDLAIWDKAVLYQLVHGVAALLISSAANLILPLRSRQRVVWLMLTSIVVFSGSLYILVLTGQRWLGMITPLGGMGFIVSWSLLAFQLVKAQKDG